MPILGYKKDTKNPLFLMPLNVPLFLLLHLGKTDIIFYLLFLIPFLRGYSKVYNADYVGTDHGNFAALQPGEERIVTVAYLGLTKYQSKGYSSSEGVLFTDTPTLENVYIKTYAVGNVQEEEPLICLNIKNGKVVDE